jgi:hypothetical protein
VVLNVVHGDFAVKFRVRSKVDGFRWALVAVYGAAQPELKVDGFRWEFHKGIEILCLCSMICSQAICNFSTLIFY